MTAKQRTWRCWNQLYTFCGGLRKLHSEKEKVKLWVQDLPPKSRAWDFVSEGCLGGRLLHVFGAGFSPGKISAAVCGAPCQVLANATVSAFSCLVLPLDGEQKTHTYTFM